MIGAVRDPPQINSALLSSEHGPGGCWVPGPAPNFRAEQALVTTSPRRWTQSWSPVRRHLHVHLSRRTWCCGTPAAELARRGTEWHGRRAKSSSRPRIRPGLLRDWLTASSSNLQLHSQCAGRKEEPRAVRRTALLSKVSSSASKSAREARKDHVESFRHCVGGVPGHGPRAGQSKALHPLNCLCSRHVLVWSQIWAIFGKSEAFFRALVLFLRSKFARTCWLIRLSGKTHSPSFERARSDYQSVLRPLRNFVRGKSSFWLRFRTVTGSPWVSFREITRWPRKRERNMRIPSHPTTILAGVVFLTTISVCLSSTLTAPSPPLPYYSLDKNAWASRADVGVFRMPFKSNIIHREFRSVCTLRLFRDWRVENRAIQIFSTPSEFKARSKRNQNNAFFFILKVGKGTFQFVRQ